jgi:hypothetical protein
MQHAPTMSTPPRFTRPKHHGGNLNHDTEFLRIVVGQPGYRASFTVKDGLICGSSKFFDRAFNSLFVEGLEGELNLPEECPRVFEAFYDWLTTHKVGPSQRYTGGEMLPQDFWFEAYKMADRLMLGDCGYGFDESFKDFVFGRFRYLFPSDLNRIPDADLVRDIFENEPDDRLGVKCFQKHLIHHAAYWLGGRSSTTLATWNDALAAHPKFDDRVEVRRTQYALAVHPFGHASTMRVHFEGPGLGQCASVSLSATISSLKKKFKVLRQNIYYNGIELNGECRLSDHDIEHESSLTLSAQRLSSCKSCTGHPIVIVASETIINKNIGLETQVIEL